MTKNIFFVQFLIYFIFSSHLLGQERVSHFKPDADPDRIILTIKDDPSVSMAVTWRTDTTVSETIAQISMNLPSVYLADSSVTVSGSYSDVSGDGVTARYHSVNFTGLRPETSYAYRVGSGKNTSEWFQFSTAASIPKPFSFIFFGDSQIRDKSLFSRIIREAFKEVPDAAFLLYAGDIVDGGDRIILQDEEWGEWHGAGSFINGMIPTLPVTGNHEYIFPGDRTGRELNRYWIPGFTLPENGPAGLIETVYYVDYQGVRIICLNSYELIRNNDLAEKQVAWLEELLKNNPCNWTIVTFHHPIFSTSAKRDNVKVRNALKPLFDKYKVDMVLSGHDHTYARGHVPPPDIRPGSSRIGTVYVVSVSGAKQYEQDAVPWWDTGTSHTQFFQDITVNGKQLFYKAVNSTGEVFDKFVLTKKPDGSKLLSGN